MGTVYNASIVKNGLYVYLDAANKKSNTGNGSILYDLSGKKNSTTIINGVALDSNNGGSFVFDGTNKAVTIPNNITYTNGFSISLWVYPLLLDTTVRRIIDKTSSTSNSVGGLFLHATDTNIFLNVDAATVGISISPTNMPINTWKNIAFTTTNTGLTNFYINGSLFQSGTLNPPSGITTTNLLTIANRSSGYDRGFNGRIASFMLYQSVLSDSEIRQNFEALRGRYKV